MAHKVVNRGGIQENRASIAHQIGHSAEAHGRFDFVTQYYNFLALEAIRKADSS